MSIEASVRGVLRRAGAEPLVHFVGLGLGLFVLHRVVAGPPAPPPDTVVVSASTQAWLVEQFEQRHARAPTQAERAQLVARHVDEEVLYREGLALGLDRGDPIVRRRIVQRMQMLLEDLREPDAAQLQAYFEANASRYAAPARHSIEQLYFTGPDAQGRAEAARAELASGRAPTDTGDAFAHGTQLRARNESQLAGVFGAGFAATVARAPVGQWRVARSALGWHTLRVEARVPGEVPALAQVHARVVQDWRRAQTDAAPLAALRARYRIDREPLP